MNDRSQTIFCSQKALNRVYIYIFEAILHVHESFDLNLRMKFVKDEMN